MACLPFFEVMSSRYNTLMPLTDGGLQYLLARSRLFQRFRRARLALGPTWA